MSEPILEPDETWNEPEPKTIPPASYWPAVLALGLTVAAMGLTMIWVIVVFGLAITAVAVAGWIGAMTRHG